MLIPTMGRQKAIGREREWTMGRSNWETNRGREMSKQLLCRLFKVAGFFLPFLLTRKPTEEKGEKSRPEINLNSHIMIIDHEFMTKHISGPSFTLTSSATTECVAYTEENRFYSFTRSHY